MNATSETMVPAPVERDHDPMRQLVIVADDLTGAADCAARCSSFVDHASLFLQPPLMPLSQGVIAVTTDSRHLPPADAADRVRELIDRLPTNGEVLWYKKIDSTLRGNLGSEVDAMLEALGRRIAVIAPAFPAQGRGLEQGVLRSPGHDPASPHLPTLLRQQSRHPVIAVPVEDVRAGRTRLAARLALVAAYPTALVVVDALSDDDLRTVAAAASDALPRALLCGSAGLVGIVAEQLSGGRRPSIRQEAVIGPDDRVALIVGSASPRAHAQIAYLRHRGRVQVRAVGQEQRIDLRQDALLHLAPTPTLPAAEQQRQLARTLADSACRLIGRIQPSLLVLVGGDTTLHVLARLGVRQLDVVRELLPGMPLTVARDAINHPRFVIIKAGNHGDDTALHVLLRQARGNDLEE